MSLQDRVCIVTGASNGVGAATAEAMAERGAEVHMLCRSRDKGETVLAGIVERTGNKNVHLLLCDLGSLADIRRAAAEFLALNKPLHILINNAGVVNRKRCETSDGFEEMFGVNHLGYFLFTELLRDKLIASAPSRVVSVSSEAHAFCKSINWDDLNWERSKYATFTVYGHSKLCNILWTRELARQLEGTGVIANCLHPGAVSTGLGTQGGGLLAKVLTTVLKPFFRTPLQGAATSIYLATSDDVDAVSGQYFKDCKVKQPKPWAQDDAAARRLWQVSEELVATN